MARFIILLSLLLSACGGSPTSQTSPNQTSDSTLQVQGTYLVGNPIAEETTPVVWNGRLLSILFIRPLNGIDQVKIEDIQTKEVLVSFDTPDFCIGSAIVVNQTLYLFGTTGLDNTNVTVALGNSVQMISTTDMKTWTAPVMVFQTDNQHAIWNTSVAPDSTGYIMAYDISGSGIASFGQAFAHSPDLLHWTLVGQIFSPYVYSTAVTIRYSDGYYYLFHTSDVFEPTNGYTQFFETTIDRSPDLINWQASSMIAISPYNDSSAGIGTTDMDLTEFQGKTYVLYSVGNQGYETVWQNVNLAVFDGTESDYLKHFFK